MSGSALPIHVEALGLAPGDRVESFLLIHGYGASSFTWRHWAPRLAKRGHVVLMDMKGFGRAPKPDDGRYGPEDQAGLVRRLIEERGLRDLTIVGHSLGGGVALLTALGLQDDRSPRLRRLTLVAGAAYEQRLPPFVRLADYPRMSELLLRLIGPTALVRFVLSSIVYDRSSIDPDQIRGYAEPLRSPSVVRSLIGSARQIRPQSLERLAARYRTLDVPTLLIWGRHDPVVPLWVGQRLVRELPDARLHVFEECGHLPPEEWPEESYSVLEAFLDER